MAREVKAAETNVVAVERNFFKLRLPVISNRSQRLFRMLIAKIDDKNDQTIPWLVFDLPEVFELLGLKSDSHAWTKVRQALTELRQAEVVIPESFFKSGQWDEALREYLGHDEGVTEHTGFIRSFRTYSKRGKFAVLIERTMIPFLLDVKRFQKYQIAEILNFKKEYTIRFYEWFIAARVPANTARSGSWYYNISIKELRKRLDLDHPNGRPKKYPAWKDLRRRVIEPSCDEIGESADFLVSFEPVKKRGSQAYSSITFHLTPKPKAKAKAKKASAKKTQDLVDPQSAKEKNRQRFDMLWKLYQKHSKDEDLVAKFQEAEGAMINQVIGTLSPDMAKEVGRNAGLDAIESDLIARETAPQ